MPKKTKSLTGRTSRLDTQIELVYDGPEVQDGTLAVEDMISALVGFGRAYAKVNELFSGPEEKHKLRVTGLERNSADIIISVQMVPVLDSLLPHAQGILMGVGAVLGGIAAVIKAKRVVGKEKNPTINVTNNGVVIVNKNNTQVTLDKRAYNLYKSGLIDADLDQMTRPLVEGAIDLVELRDEHKKPIPDTRISAEERDIFRIKEESVTTTKDDVILVGELRSLNKNTNRGQFVMNDGKRVSYKFATKKPQALYKGFAYSGQVKVRCRAHFDANLDLSFIEIFGVEPLQKSLIPGA
jgi:hypothetical protein